MISVVCVYNDENMLASCLLASLNEQTTSFDLIKIDNTSGNFHSAAEALNYGAKKAKGKYIMFVHQDVSLSSSSWLEDTEKWLEQIEKLGVAGVAGMSESGKSNRERGRNIIHHGNPVKKWSWGNSINEPEQVQTLDECLMIVPSSVFSLLKFDEKTCDNWHLYGVDYCLSCKEQGFKVAAIPMDIYHASDGLHKSIIHTLLSIGPFPESYYNTLEILLRKHHDYFSRVYTTCGDWNTFSPLIIQRICKLGEAGMELFHEKLKPRS